MIWLAILGLTWSSAALVGMVALREIVGEWYDEWPEGTRRWARIVGTGVCFVAWPLVYLVNVKVAKP